MKIPTLVLPDHAFKSEHPYQTNQTIIKHINKKVFMKSTLLKLRMLAITVLIANIFLAGTTQGQAVNDYRSANSTNWNVLTTWERYNGATWVTPTAGEGVPTSADGAITIRSPHTVTVTANVTVDQVTVDAGGKVTVNNVTLTIANGAAATDFTVNGTLEATGGSGAITTTGALAFGSGGSYIHNRNGSLIPTATWDPASTCNVTGITTAIPTIASFGPASGFGHFVWNSPSQTADLSLGGELNNVDGNFTVTSTGSGSIVLGLTGVGNLAILGDFSQTGGEFTITDGVARTITLTGDFSVTGGTFNLSTGGSGDNGILSVGGDFTHTAGTITETGTTTASNITFAAGTHLYTSGGTLTNLVNMIVSNGSTLQMGTGAVPAVIPSTSTGAFTLAGGATLGVTSALGITTSGATGNIQSTGTRTYTAAANYIYNGSANQAVGNGLTQNSPANITISNTGTSGNNTVTSAVIYTQTGNLNITQGNYLVTGNTGNYVTNGNMTVATGASFTHGVQWGTNLVSVGGNIDISGQYLLGSGVTRAHVQMTGTSKTLRTGTSALNIFTLTGGATVTANGNVTVNDNFWVPLQTSGTFSTGGFAVVANAGLLIAGGTFNVNGGSLTVTSGIAVGYPGALVGNLNISSGSVTTDGITLGDATGTVANTITHTGGTLQVNGAVTIHQPAAGATNGTTNNWNINAQTVTVTGGISFAGTQTASRVARISISTGTLNAEGGISFVGTTPANKVILMSGGAGTVNMKGALSGASGATLTSTATSIFNYNDNVSAQTVNFFGSGSYSNLHINTTGGVGATLSAAITAANVTANLRVQSGTLNNGGFAIAGNAGATFEVANGAFFQLAGVSSAFPTAFGTNTLGATSTVDYRGSGAQTISAQNYGNLTTTLNGTRTITLANSGNIDIRGVFSPAAGTTSYTNTGSTVRFTGTTGSQNIPAFSFNNLTINNTSGVVLTGNVSVNGTTNALTFTNGKITTGANVLTLASGVTVTTAAAGKYVFGNLAANIPAGTPSRSFFVGDATNYTPVDVAFTTTISTPGVMTVFTTPADHTNINTSGINPALSINRTWTLANTTISPVGYSATFNFIGPTPGSGDIDAGVNTATVIIERYTGSWSPTTIGTRTALSSQATAINGFGDFQIGNIGCTPPTIPAPSITNVTCFGGSDGAIDITPSGGSTPFTYLWSNGATTQDITGVVAGPYSVTITANGGCTVNSGTITVGSLAVLNASVASAGISCNGGPSDGTITITSPSGGSGSYEYSANGGGSWQGSGSFTGLAVGTYDVRIRDLNHPTCVIILNGSLSIGQPAVLNATVTPTNPTCNSGSNGAINITAPSGGYGTYEYSINGGGSWSGSGSFTGLAAGFYNVQIRDAAHTACVVTLNASLELTQPAAVPPPTSGGDETVCTDGNPLQTLIATATSPFTITWWDMASGGTEVTPAQIGVGTSTYYAEANDGTCSSLTRTAVTLTIQPILATPGAISGPTDACPLIDDVIPTVYSIAPVAGASSYTWTVPVGVTIVSGQGSTDLSVTFDNSFALTNSRFRVIAESPTACPSAESILTVLKNIPSIPGAISGPTDACPFAGQPTNAVYSIAPVNFASSYTWTVPTGASIVSGQGSTSINVSYLGTFTSGIITVTAMSNCGNRAPKTLSITRQPPVTPGVITGPTNACPFIGTLTEATYSISAVTNATSYTWTVPANVTLVSGQGGLSINVTFDAGYSVASLIKVKAISNCAESGERTLSVLASTYGTPGVITGPTNACGFIATANDATYTIRKVTNAASYIWTVPAGATIASHPGGAGVNDTIITVSYDNSFVSGTNISVQADGCIPSAARNLTILRVLPVAPVILTGATNACPFMVSVANPSGIPVLYTTRRVATANSYTWTVPSGSSITAHPAGIGVNDTTIEVTYSAGFTSGSVTVSATNTCGTGPARSLVITRLTPGAPGSMSAVQSSPCPGRIYTYSLPAMPTNATSILWTVPPAGSLLTGQGSTSITVSYPSTVVTGNVTATPYNNCANSATRTLAVNLPACVGPRPITGSENIHVKPLTMEVSVFPNPSVSDFKLQVITAGSEKIQVRILDLGGRMLNSFTIKPYETIRIGNELKAGSYLIEVRQGKQVSTKKLNKF